MEKALFVCYFQIPNPIVSIFPANDLILLVDNYVFVWEHGLGDFDSGFPNISFVPLEFQQKVFPEAHLPNISQNADALSVRCNVLYFEIYNVLLDWLLVVQSIQRS